MRKTGDERKVDANIIKDKFSSLLEFHFQLMMKSGRFYVMLTYI